jgi:aspartate/methionine/tyrosine aminotransferase
VAFSENRYLSWYMERAFRHDDAVNLHASGVPAIEPLEIPGDRVSPWKQMTDFEAALAGWLGIPEQEVLFTPGATGGTLLALACLVRPGSTVLVDLPMYEPMVAQAERLGQVQRLQRRFEDRWRLPLEQARHALKGNVSVVMLCEPGNPTGTFSDRQDVIDLVRMAERKGAYVLINEVYRGFSNRLSYHGIGQNVLVVSSLSKLLGAYSYRLGWLSGSSEEIVRLRMGHFNLGVGTSPAAVAGGRIVASRADGIRAEALAQSRHGAQVVDQWVRKQEGLTWHIPEGPGFGCIRLPDGMDDMAFAERLHDEHGVLLVPGSLFELPGTVRVSWLQAGGRLEEGLEVLGRMLR